jgi:SAM-dependent methyltransferase
VTHLAKALRWRGVTTVAGGVETLDGLERQYDAIWSLSVVEHIADEHGEDREAVKRMWRALRPGGRLILTVPTDKQAWDEYRDRDHYGTQQLANAEGAHFFQRFYDAEAIRARICAAIGQAPAAMEWFGEKTPGHFHAYVARWLQAGQRATLRDPLDVAMNYRTYAQFADMPGAGVCGLLFIKP